MNVLAFSVTSQKSKKSSLKGISENENWTFKNVQFSKARQRFEKYY